MKPAKPSTAFPLFAHNNGQWAKKVRGKTFYFGSWDDPHTALAEYERRKNRLDFGKKPTLENIRPTVERKALSNRKPRKPNGDFPLYAHKNGQWAKKIRSKVHYFGPWVDSDGALQRYLDEKDDLNAGRTPRHRVDGLTMRDLANRFLTVKKHLVDTGELSPRTFGDYYATCERIINAFGKTRLVIDLASDDFEKLRVDFSKTRGPVALGNEVQRVRVVFKYAYDAGIVDRPVRFGPTFKRPSKKVLRKVRQQKGPRMFEADEVRVMLEAASAQLRAMILLGINCGFGNNDVATLPLEALDLETGWVEYPRPKTNVERRVPLWPQSTDALRTAIATRPQPKDDTNGDLVFITKYGKPWAKATSDNPISNETAKFLKKTGIHRPGLNFYALRHTFETIAGETRDQVAVDHIMGHARDDMASVYRERISDERLVAVTEFVRRWLFGDGNDS